MDSILVRRKFIQSSLALGTLALTPGAFANELDKTPPMVEGPFYPNPLPLDTDNDLLIINDEVLSLIHI